MDLTWTNEYAVQAGRARIVPFVWLLPLTGLRAPESGIDCRVLGVITVVSTLVSVASRLVFAIFSFRGAGVACIVFAMGQPTVLARTKRVMSAMRAAMDFGFSWPRWRASHSSRMLIRLQRIYNF